MSSDSGSGSYIIDDVCDNANDSNNVSKKFKNNSASGSYIIDDVPSEAIPVKSVPKQSKNDHCVICHAKYNKIWRRRNYLSCGHDVCKDCFRRIGATYDSYKDSSSTSIFAAKIALAKCPQCRKKGKVKY